MRTLATLANYLRQSHGKPDEWVTACVKQAVRNSWPQGKESAALRLEKLHKRRDDELARPVLSRDYGAVLKMYRKELAEVKTVEPKSDLISALDGEISDLEAKRKDLYPRAVKVLEGGIYETSFLESFLSNFPAATQ